MKPVWIRILVAALIVAGCNSTEPAASPGAAVNGQGLPAGGAVEAGPGQAVIRVNGMSCPNCANYIGYELKKIKGVRDVTFDLGKGTVTATYGGRTPTETEWRKAVEDGGFTYVSATGGAAAIAAKTCEACTCGDCNCGKGGHCKANCVCG